MEPKCTCRFDAEPLAWAGLGIALAAAPLAVMGFLGNIFVAALLLGLVGLLVYVPAAIIGDIAGAVAERRRRRQAPSFYCSRLRIHRDGEREYLP